MEPGITRGGVVEGRFVTDILLDTGCSRTLVKKDLVPPGKIREGEAVTIRCAHGDTVLYPLAEVDMELQGMKIKVEAAVSPNLPASVLLGTDVPVLKELLGDSIKLEGRREEVVLVTVTRAQKKKQLIEEDAERQQEQESGAQTHMLDANPLTPPQTEDTVQTEIVPEVQSVTEEAVPEDKSQTETKLRDSEPMNLGNTIFLHMWCI